MTIQELWELPPHEFNEWRRKNDLLALFEHFKQVLSHFDEWLTANSLTIEKILATEQPGKFFYYESEVFVTKVNERGFLPYSFYELKDKKDRAFFIERDKEGFFFLPYLIWIKKKLKKKKVISTKFYSGDLETFGFTRYAGALSPEHSNAFLCTGFQVIKMGGVTINGWGNFLLRNLDFCDLDFLTINGNIEWQQQSDILYSTFRNLKAVSARGNYKRFFQCHFEDIFIVNSKLVGFEFHDCEMYECTFENASINLLTISRCPTSLFSFDKSTLVEMVYDPPENPNYTSISSFYRTLRVLYQNTGSWREASQAFYKERFYEMKSFWQNASLWNSIRKYSFKHTRYSASMIAFHASTLLNFISGLANYLVWGFGEKPFRIVLSALSTIIIYSAFYYYSCIAKVDLNIINSFYLSTVTFTTLGFGDITPIDSGSINKILVASEALLGAFLMGLLVAGFSNKSKY